MFACPSSPGGPRPSSSSFRRVVLVVLAAAFLLPAAVALRAQSPPATQDTPAATPAATPTAEVIPPVPTHWFSDYAKVVGPIFAIGLDRRLEAFEHETTNQFLVVLYPRMQTAASVDDYCLRIYNAWHIGRKGVNNGVVLFVFVQDRKLRIEVGRGLEGVLTTPVCQEIVRTIAARFRTGDCEGGLTAGVDAIVKTLHTAQPSPHPAAP